MPPVDITSPSQVSELNKRISIGPITLVLVYADWCGHCQRFKPMMEQLENMSGRTVQTARIRDDMVPQSSLLLQWFRLRIFHPLKTFWIETIDDTCFK